MDRLLQRFTMHSVAETDSAKFAAEGTRTPTRDPAGPTSPRDRGVDWLAYRTLPAMRLYDELPPDALALVLPDFTELLDQRLFEPVAQSIASAPGGCM
jgi:hypothetical protein